MRNTKIAHYEYTSNLKVFPSKQLLGIEHCGKTKRVMHINQENIAKFFAFVVLILLIACGVECIKKFKYRKKVKKTLDDDDKSLKKEVLKRKTIYRSGKNPDVFRNGSQTWSMSFSSSRNREEFKTTDEPEAYERVTQRLSEMDYRMSRSLRVSEQYSEFLDDSFDDSDDLVL